MLRAFPFPGRAGACLAVLLLAAGVFGAASRLAAETAGAPVAAGPPASVVYVFRAMGGKFVTKEMDNLAAAIAARGFTVEVFNYTSWMRPAKDVARRFRDAGAGPRIIAVGHSAGGDSAIRFALALNRADVPVDLIITLDPTRIANRVPSNVERFINIFSSAHTLGGGAPKPARDFNGHFASVDLKNYSDIWHLRMPRMAGLQDLVVAKISEAVSLPADPKGEGVPIEYAPPEDMPLEVWDTGVPVVAEAGDTAAVVAAEFGVPAWAVADINDLDAERPLAAGQRVIVPRHLTASTAAAD